VEGLLDLRGAAIPVVRLERLLSLAEAAPRLSSLLIVLRPEDGGLALLADEVTGIRELSPEERLEAPAATSFNGCVDGTALDSGDPLYLLSLERLLLLRERQAAEHFQALEQARMASEVAEAR
jgi:chemotaxis signal transduction protein